MSEQINFESKKNAQVYGESIAQLPQDLYIPPDALEVYLDSFQGPLDLLLYLIRKNNIDILDIPMTALTSQYIEYVERMKQIKSEIGGEVEQLQPTGLENEFKTVPGVQALQPECEPEMQPVEHQPQQPEEDDNVFFGDAPESRTKKVAYN